MQDGRSRSRVEGHFDVELRCAAGSMPVVSQNLSMKGMLCTAPGDTGLGPGQGCSLRLTLASDVALDIDAVAVRVQGRRLALRFEAMDVTTFGHLRNLVRFSSPDPDAVDGELARALHGDGTRDESCD